MSTQETPSNGRLVALALGALGVVYGDIGTSPLYAIKECFFGSHSVDASNAYNVYGVLSLVFWSLTMVVSVKYLAFIMSADNRGEGGIFALLALIPSDIEKISKYLRSGLVFAALFGAALLYGDGIITPAISVLSAVEGLEVATKAAHPFIVPLTCLILFILFSIQKHGTARIGFIFGPIMLAWFVILILLGGNAILEHPKILYSINPYYGFRFFLEHQVHGFVVLGSVVLAITGAEALYADMGHFGKKPIRLSWYSLVFPSLLINYFGQGAYVLSHATTSSEPINPFFALVPSHFLYPMVALSTAATVIASQAMISGAFSITRQAIQFGLCPRMHIKHTSDETQGQIYIPFINGIMMVSCIGLVLAFRESSNLAAAYGMAVTANMVITSLLYYFVVRRAWVWPLGKSILLVGMFLFFDLCFFGSNLFKFMDGGWFPIVIAIVLLICMTTWSRGRKEMAAQVSSSILPLNLFLKDIGEQNPHRVPGTAVFMSSLSDGAPPVLLHHFKHNQVLHQQVVLLSIKVTDTPYVAKQDQIHIEDLGHGFYRLVASYGFMQSPDVPDLMVRAAEYGVVSYPNATSYFLGRETLLVTGPSTMARWRKKLFWFISRNAQNPTAFFGIPPGRVVELGVQIKL